MRADVRRSWAAGVAAVALAAALTACTGDSDDDGSGANEQPTAEAVSATAAAGKQACADGTYTWSGVGETQRLTGLSESERFGKGGGRLTNKTTRVYTPRQSVESHGATLSSAEVLFSLGKKAGVIDSKAATLAKSDDGETYSFTDVNDKAPELDEVHPDELTGAGNFVRYTYTTEVAGDFRYSCGDGTVVLGHAVGWKGDGDGALDCDASLQGGTAAHAAARLACPEGSAAVKSGT